MAGLRRPAIGLVGHAGDPELARLAGALEARGAAPVPLDLADLPAHVNFHWDHEAMRFGQLDLLTLRAVYARTAHFPEPVSVPGTSPAEADAMTFELRELGSLRNAILAELAWHLPVVNPPGCHQYHRLKPLMYRTLQRAQVPVPDFAVGCDLEQAAHFVDRHQQQVVVKPLMGGQVLLADFAFLKAQHAEFDRRPLLLQRRVVGRSLRGYVVHGHPVAVAEIVHGAVVDWRADVQAIRPVQATEMVAAVLGAASAALGLAFSAVDLEEEGGAGGPPWVLDVNPAPMFAGFEQQSGLDVSGPLASYLLQRARLGGDAAHSAEGCA